MPSAGAQMLPPSRLRAVTDTSMRSPAARLLGRPIVIDEAPAALSATVCAAQGALVEPVLAVAVPVGPAVAWFKSLTPVAVPEPLELKLVPDEKEVAPVPHSRTTRSSSRVVVAVGAVGAASVPWPLAETSTGAVASTPV